MGFESEEQKINAAVESFIRSGKMNTYILNLVANKFVYPISSADADAPNNTVYFSTDAGVLVYRDSTGTVNNLY